MQSSVKILLSNNNNTNVCYPGQILNGTVQCTFASEKTIRAIRITFKGVAKTKWFGKSPRYSFWAKQIYFSEERILAQAHGGTNLKLAAGVHVYPFSYVLPHTLPSSFVQRYGSIRYSIKLLVERPWKSNYKEKFSLVVNSPLNLDAFSNAREPFSRTVKTKGNWFWFNSDTVTLTISLPSIGYAGDQQIDIGSYLQNMTIFNIKSIQYQIKRLIQFTAHHPYTSKKHLEDIVASCNEGTIRAHEKKSWTSTLVVPMSSVLNFVNCNIIDVTYCLTVKVFMSFPYSNLEIACPLVLGTTPLTDFNASAPLPRLPEFTVHPPTAPPVEEYLAETSYCSENVSNEIKKL